MIPNPQILFEEIVPVKNQEDARQLKWMISNHAGRLRMAALNQTKLITATSELATNMLSYGGGGQVLVQIIIQYKKEGIRLTFKDKGPGIADIDLVMQDGYSTGNSLGIGLPGTRRLVDVFLISSEVNKGTTVTITKWIHG